MSRPADPQRAIIIQLFKDALAEEAPTTFQAYVKLKVRFVDEHGISPQKLSNLISHSDIVVPKFEPARKGRALPAWVETRNTIYKAIFI